MKYNIPKEWVEQNAHKEEGLEIGAGVSDYAQWKSELNTLARKRGLDWLLADDEAWMLKTYNDGDTAKEALDHLIAEATRNA